MQTEIVGYAAAHTVGRKGSKRNTGDQHSSPASKGWMDLFAGLVFLRNLRLPILSLYLPVPQLFVDPTSSPSKYTTTPATSDGTTFTFTNQTDPLTLHDHAILTFPSQLVHDRPGVSRATLSFASFQVHNQNARVVRIDMGGEIVPTVRRRANRMDQKNSFAYRSTMRRYM